MKQVDKTRHALFVIGESLDDVLGVLDLRYLAKPISKGEKRYIIGTFPFTSHKNNRDMFISRNISNGKRLIFFLLVVDEHGGTGAYNCSGSEWRDCRKGNAKQ